MTLRLKDLAIIESKVILAMLPEGKLLINTINAHSYNTALKDEAFAEALAKGRVDSRRGEHRESVQMAQGKITTERKDCRMGFVRA